MTQRAAYEKRMVNVNFRMEADVKRKMEQVCDELGMSMTTAFTIFAKKMIREWRIPFEVSSDPFYSEANMKHLENIMEKVRNGTAHFEEHELIEVENE